MDYQRDYILRLIHMLGDLMRRITEKLDDRERRRMLTDACREFCGMTLETGEALDADSLREMLAPIPRFMMSELLFAKAAACELPVGDAETLQLKALRLLASLQAEGQICDLRAQKLADMKSELLEQLTAADVMECARFFFQAERYDEMEDALFQALKLESGEARELMRQEAVELLRRAAKANEKTLALCGMTGQELRQSAHELEPEADVTFHEQEKSE